MMASSDGRPPAKPSSPTFKLRPRSNSRSFLEEIGFGFPSKQQLSADTEQSDGIPPNTISPDGPMHPSSQEASGGGCNEDHQALAPVPCPSFMSFLSMGESTSAPTSTTLNSPIKKHKKTREDSPGSSQYTKTPSTTPGKTPDSLLSSPATPRKLFFPTFPSTPPSVKFKTGDSNRSIATPSGSSTGKRSLPSDEEETEEPAETPGGDSVSCPETIESPFTPEGRRLLADFCIDTPPVPSLSERVPPSRSCNDDSSKDLSQKGKSRKWGEEEASPLESPDSAAEADDVCMKKFLKSTMHSNSTGQKSHYLPDTPTFSFSPSLKLASEDGNPALEFDRFKSVNVAMSSSSPVRGTIGSGSLGSNLGTPLGTPQRVSNGLPSSTNSSPFHSVRGTRGTPIGHQLGSVFKMLPPRNSLYPNGRGGDTIMTNSYTASPSASVSTFACMSSGRSSPNVGTPCFSNSSPSPRMVPLTVLSKDGSPMIAPQKLPSFDPSPSSASPLMRSLDHDVKSPPDHSTMDRSVKMPSMLSSPMSSGNDDYHILPRIKLTPRAKGNSLTSKLHSYPSPRSEDDEDLALPRLNRSMIKAASSFVTEDSPGAGENVSAEMDSLLNGFGHHKASHCDNSYGDDKEVKTNSSDLGRVESEEAEVAALTQGPFQMPSLWLPPAAAAERNDGRCQSTLTVWSDSSTIFSPNPKPVPSITFNLPQQGQGNANSGNVASPSLLPRQVPSVMAQQPKYRSLFGSPTSDEADPLERIIRADAIAQAARSDEPLTDDDSDGEDGGGADFLLCLPEDTEGGDGPQVAKINPPRLSSKTSLSAYPASTILEERANFRRDKSDGTFATLCTLSDADPSDIGMSSPRFSARALKSFCSRQSMNSMLSASSLCGLDIVHESSHPSNDGDRMFSSSLFPSESAESIPAFHGFKPLRRSEISLTSLGLSVDSIDAGADQRDQCTPLTMGGMRRNSSRDLFTPPMGVSGARNSKHVLSPPPLRSRQDVVELNS